MDKTVTGIDMPESTNSLVIPIFFLLILFSYIPYSLISISTPEAKSNFIKASTVCGVGSNISINLL